METLAKFSELLTVPNKNTSLGRNIVLFFLITFFFTSCENKSYNIISEEEKKQTDSIVYANKNEESLRKLISQFKESGNSYGEIISYKELGRILREKSSFIKSIDIHKKGLDKAIQVKDTIQIVQALNNIATNYRRMGVLDEAAVFHYQALALCNAYSDKESEVARKNRVVSLNGIGNIHMTMQNYEIADSVLRQALAGEQSLGSDLGQAINYANLGYIFEARTQMDSALYYYQQSMKHNRLAKSDLGIALCYDHFGRLFEKANELDSAIMEYHRAYDISSSSNDVWHWLESCLSLTRVYIAKGDLNIAEEYLQKAKETATEINSLEHIAEVYRLEYLLSRKNGNISKALDCYILSRQFSDSVSNEKKLVQMQNTRINYERELKKNEIGKIQKDFQTERAQRRIFVIGLLTFIGIACIVIVLLVYINRLRAQKNKIIRKADKMRSTFFTNITHEFRTPLTVIQAAAQELKDNSEEGTAVNQNASDILTHEKRLLNLINQILDIAKMDATVAKSSQWKHGDIVEFITVLCESLRSYAAEKKISIIFSPQEKPVNMDFIPDYVQKIICNLVSNAVKFSDTDSKVYVATRVNNGNVQIFVSDTGIGISPEQKEDIFTPFYQASENASNVGSGIGLSVVKIAVEKMGGKIDVHSAIGEGSMFIVTLPVERHKSDAEEFDIADYFKTNTVQKADIAAKSKPEENDNEISDNDDTPIVLIIEDTPEVARYMMRQLNPKYHYVFAENGYEGLEKANQTVPDIIITDVMMPYMDGFELCKKVRESELLNHIPVIMVTAKVSHEDRMLGLEAGADAYIEKPFHADELNIRVEKLLEQRRVLQNKFSKAFRDDIDNVEKETETVVITDTDKMFLTKVSDAVKAQISDGKIDYNALAFTLCLSRAQLNRKIKAITGETTTDLILKIKISLAKQLLDNTDKSIIEIAMECGMDSDSYFCTLFKKATGQTPLQYRNRK